MKKPSSTDSNILKKVHPDVSKQETFSAAEVAAIVNDIRKTQK
jgi:uncharacterized protein YfkK (UPF0435 family)